MQNKLLKGLMLFVAIIYIGTAHGEQNEWKNLAVFEKGMQEKHTSFMYFENAQSALNNDWSRSEFYQSLNGKWKFIWSRKPKDCETDFYKLDYDNSNWKSINVPGDWQMQGYGVPYYVNSGYPFRKDPPNAPENYNPVGSYVKEFSLPENWQSKEVFLHFGGVNSAF
jgi:beta-galactosidase